MSDLYSHQALPAGTMIQEYRLDRILGIGGFGIVYAAENIYLDESVAIKEFLPAGLATRIEVTQVVPISKDKEEIYDWALKNFLKEAKILWELSRPIPHRSIVRVTRFHEENGTAYMVMDYEEGQALSSILEKTRLIPEEQVIAILYPLLDGLKKVHAASIWHRDIKPDNILVRSDGSPVLIDFGAAHRDTIGNDRSQMSVFSPAFAAPEQIYQSGEQGPWTDIYALGVTLYLAVTGISPPTVSQRNAGNECTPASEIAKAKYSPGLLHAIDAALILDPESRPQSIDDWRSMIERVSIDSEDPGVKTVLRSNSLVTHRPKSLSGNLVKAEETVTPAVISSRQDSVQNDRLSSRYGILGGLGIVGIVLLVGGAIFFDWQPIRQLPEKIEIAATTEDKRLTEGAAEVDRDEKIDRNAIIFKIEQVLDSFDCSRLEAKLDAELQLQLTGFVRSENDLRQLDKEIAAQRNISRVGYDIEVLSWPFCEMAALLARRQPSNIPLDEKARITVNKPSLRYKEGDYIVVTATSSNAFDGYLYIDYLDSAGDVVHMFPSPFRTDNRIFAGQQIVAGTEKNSSDSTRRAYQVFPPHGKNMIVVIASKEPLYYGERAEVEPVEHYLSSLRSGLKRIDSEASSVDFISTYIFIDTHE